jgi:hypothetical protein
MNENSLRLSPHDNQDNWQVDETENCTFLPKIADANKEPYLVNIWKTMPLIPRALPKDNIPMILNDKVYCNDPQCFPSVVTPRYKQNYRSLPREKNRAFDHRWIKHGETLQLASWNKDYDSFYVTTKKDPSFCYNCASEHPAYHVQIDYLPHTFQKWQNSTR